MREGQWWGGLYGWTGRYGHNMMIHSMTAAVEAAVLVTGPSLWCSMSRMLDAAGINTRSLLGPARIKGLGLIYANAFRVWLGDDSEDMAKTMAALDKGLRCAERLQQKFRDERETGAQAA